MKYLWLGLGLIMIVLAGLWAVSSWRQGLLGGRGLGSYRASTSVSTDEEQSTSQVVVTPATKSATVTSPRTKPPTTQNVMVGDWQLSVPVQWQVAMSETGHVEYRPPDEEWTIVMQTTPDNYRQWRDNLEQSAQVLASIYAQLGLSASTVEVYEQGDVEFIAMRLADGGAEQILLLISPLDEQTVMMTQVKMVGDDWGYQLLPDIAAVLETAVKVSGDESGDAAPVSDTGIEVVVAVE